MFGFFVDELCSMEIVYHWNSEHWHMKHAFVGMLQSGPISGYQFEELSHVADVNWICLLERFFVATMTASFFHSGVDLFWSVELLGGFYDFAERCFVGGRTEWSR